MDPVFVSYSSADRPHVDTICQFLEDSGIRCWIAHRNEPAGQEFEQPIVDAIRKAPACVFVLTRSANLSRHVANEVSLACNAGRPLVPFRLEAFPLTGYLLYYLSRYQEIDATSGLDEPALLKLVETLRRLAPEAPSAAETADPLRTLQIAAEQGNAQAQFDLACHYADPRSPDSKPVEAAKWFRAAAENGHPESARRLAIAYWSGEGVLRNETEAVRWCRIAATLGDTQAAAMWGRVLLHGTHTGKDPAEAARWFQKAAEAGNPDAIFQLALLYCDGCGVERNDYKAITGLRHCAGLDNPDAQFRLAWMISQGRDAAAGPGEAIVWAERAASRGHEMARRLVLQLTSSK